MNEHTPLPASVRIAQEVVEALKLAGIDPEQDEDFATLLDSECDLQEQLRQIVRAAHWASKQAEGCKAIESEIAERRKRFEDKSDRLKQLVLWALQESGLPKLTAPDFTVSIAKGKAPLLVTCGADDLPDTVCTIKREVSKTKLREALEAGAVFDGVSFGNASPYLTARFK